MKSNLESKIPNKTLEKFKMKSLNTLKSILGFTILFYFAQWSWNEIKNEINSGKVPIELKEIIRNKIVAEGYVSHDWDIEQIRLENGEIIIESHKKSTEPSLILPIAAYRIIKSELSGTNTHKYNPDTQGIEVNN